MAHMEAHVRAQVASLLRENARSIAATNAK
jgi:hypothetical protein